MARYCVKLPTMLLLLRHLEDSHLSMASLLMTVCQADEFKTIILRRFAPLHVPCRRAAAPASAHVQHLLPSSGLLCSDYQSRRCCRELSAKSGTLRACACRGANQEGFATGVPAGLSASC
jgi:hypothetical protein